MILELDVGNSRIKWRLIRIDSPTPVQEGHVPGLEALSAIPELDALDAEVVFARMCSVRGGEVNEQIANWVRDRHGISVAQAVVTRTCGGVTNQYADVTRLGIDRWLAMLAAYRRAQGACLVIDSGTAFTLDVVDNKGFHLGGYIIPGLELMRSSLETKTAIRLSEGYSAVSQELGHSTDEAVFNGTLTALLATIEQQCRKTGAVEPVKIYFAGGDAQLLHDHSKIADSEVVSSLVFDGLDVACPLPPSLRA